MPFFRGLFRRWGSHIGVITQTLKPVRARALQTGGADFFFVAADYVKFHEVRRAAHEERRSRHDSDDVPALDQLLFEQAFFGGLDEFLDVLHLGRSFAAPRPSRARAAGAFPESSKTR